MVGDSDDEIPVEHTLALREGLPDAQLAVLPGTGHGGIDIRIVIEFLTERAEGEARSTRSNRRCRVRRFPFV
jgi:pimeloyl-ACP methyl ester carboxylesterase